MGKLYVTGRAKQEVNADMVNIKLTFEVVDRNATKALFKATDQCEHFLTKLDKAGFDLSKIHLLDDDIEQNSYSEKITYEATRRIEFLMPFHIKEYNSFVDMIRREQYNISLDTEYIVSNIEEIRELLLQEAVLNSQNKAEKIAQAMKKKIVGCEEVNLDGDYSHYHVKDTDYLPPPVNGCKICGMSSSNKMQSPKVTEEKEVNVTWLIE
ncbi:MAG: SIMPL domain-containing protein [Acidaminococcaceae bacterium]|nr:SIMPL domain-containing protein [Acidaminococcaceae bacterium]